MEFDPRNDTTDVEVQETQAEAMLRIEHGTGPLQDPAELTGKKDPIVYNASHAHDPHGGVDEVES